MSELKRRLLAGIWFALAAVVPIGYFFLRDPLNNGELPVFDKSQILLVVIPILLAGICGLGFGAQILDPVETTSARQAVGRGLLIAFLSYLILSTGSVLVLLPHNEDFIGIVAAGVIFFFYGLIFLGWIIALVGAAAGGLLYFLRLKFSVEN